MAITVLNDPRSSRSASLGASVGEGLGSILQGLAKHHLQEYINRKSSQKTAQGLMAIGFPAEEAARVALLPLPLQHMVLQRYFDSTQSPESINGEESLAQEQVSPLQRQNLQQYEEPEDYESQQVQSMQNESVPEENFYRAKQNRSSFKSRPELRATLESIAGLVTPKKLLLSELQPGNKPVKSSRQVLPEPIESTTQQAISTPTQSKMGLKAEYLQQKPSESKTFAQLLATPQLSVKDRIRLKDIQLRRDRLTSDAQDRIDRSSEKLYHQIINEYKDAKMTDMRLDRMKELNDSGKLTPALIASGLDALENGVFLGSVKKLFGMHLKMNLRGLQRGESQEFEKLSKDFLKNAKTLFGARVTEGEIRLFLQTIPSLTQSQDGRARVIRNMKIFNEAPKLRMQAMEEIIKLNKGMRPRNIDILIEEKVGQKLDQLADKFKAGIESDANYEDKGPRVITVPGLLMGQRTIRRY